MDRSIISEISSMFGPVSWYSGQDFTEKGWFLLEISPLPSREQIVPVTYDIMRGNQVDVQGGVILHSTECELDSHSIHSVVVKQAIGRLKKRTYKVAVYSGETECLGRQPVAIVLEPEISYVTFPEHPHLNMGFYDKSSDLYFPDSLCYADKQFDWGTNDTERFIRAFVQISIWLFRHLVWVESRELVKRGEWIGPGADPLPGHAYPTYLNPHGLCWCGSMKLYKNCHRMDDLKNLTRYVSMYRNLEMKVAQARVLPYVREDRQFWESRVFKPSNVTRNKLNEMIRNFSG